MRKLLPRQGCKLCAELDGDDLEAALGEREGGLAGAGADLEDPPTRSNGQREVGEELVGIGGAHPVVERSNRFECSAQLVAVHARRIGRLKRLSTRSPRARTQN